MLRETIGFGPRQGEWFLAGPKRALRGQAISDRVEVKAAAVRGHRSRFRLSTCNWTGSVIASNSIAQRWAVGEGPRMPPVPQGAAQAKTGGPDQILARSNARREAIPGAA